MKLQELLEHKGRFQVIDKGCVGLGIEQILGCNTSMVHRVSNILNNEKSLILILYLYNE